MRETLRLKAIKICDAKIAQKGDGVGLSFYAFSPIKTMTPSCSWRRRSGGSEPTSLTTLKKR